MDINNWLSNFNIYWQEHNIESVISLFSDDIEYWESPFYVIRSKDLLKKEWQAILQQQKIIIENNVYCSIDNKHAITWKLSYVKDSKQYKLAGTYLITLNKDGICNYFYYVCQHE